jgi:hypothetical protein
MSNARRTLCLIPAAAILLSAAVATAQQPWVTAEPLYGTHAVNTGFLPDPMSVAVVAGGGDQAAAIGAPATCVGMITATQPDVRVNFTAGSLPLSFFVNAGIDTTLVVNAPDGSWHCNDDSNGLNPMVRFDAPPSGQYDIWVGVWTATTTGSTGNANLLISELQPQAIECGTNAQGLTGDPGATHFVLCPAGCSNTIWGTGVYSDDSSVCTAAIHAGALNASMGGVVNVTIAPGQAEYPASTANGVASSAWGSWGRSFTVTPPLAQ